MTDYLCDTCKHAKPVRKSYYTTEDGRTWTNDANHVHCAASRPIWTFEKRTECFDYKPRKGAR